MRIGKGDIVVLKASNELRTVVRDPEGDGLWLRSPAGGSATHHTRDEVRAPDHNERGKANVLGTPVGKLVSLWKGYR
ncbi:hypothetical protein ACN20G_29755 (plasmid) [Streptomyces sp. BI20]|uniref:hypothetical protein n=1 Tax=Streptomyces sp. BI20 TaxID=3403460 RepID=UPI003C73E540